MKKLFVFIAVFVSSVSFSQRNELDSLTLAKTYQIADQVVSKLSGTITTSDIKSLSKFLYDNSIKDSIDFFTLVNPHLDPFYEKGRPTIDEHFLYASFKTLENKRNVKVEFTELVDYYDYYQDGYKKPNYMAKFKISFKDDNSFGQNHDNSLELVIDIINNKIHAIINQVEKI